MKKKNTKLNINRDKDLKTQLVNIENKLISATIGIADGIALAPKMKEIKAFGAKIKSWKRSL